MLSPTELMNPPAFELEEPCGAGLAIMGPIEDDDDYYSDLEGDDENEFEDDDQDDFELDDDDDDDGEDKNEDDPDDLDADEDELG